MTRFDTISDVHHLIERLSKETESRAIYELRLQITQQLQNNYDTEKIKVILPVANILLNDIERYSIQKSQGTDWPLDARAALAAIDVLRRYISEPGMVYAFNSSKRLVS